MRLIKRFKLQTVNVKYYFHLRVLDPLFKCIRLTDSVCKQKTKKRSSSKYYFEELRQHLLINLLNDRVSLMLFINKSPLNNAIFVNLQR